MVRFYLLGLVAVALALQASSAPSTFDGKCRSKADKAEITPGYGLLCGVRANISHDIIYYGQCLCGGQAWWETYNRCLQDVKNPKWKVYIENDKKRRCDQCSQEFKDSPGFGDGELVCVSQSYDRLHCRGYAWGSDSVY